MIPERAKAKIARLGEIAERNADNDLGRLALELSAFITETTHVEPSVAELEQRVGARFTTHELAISELHRRIPKDPDPQATVFGVPVILAEGVTFDRIREEIADLAAGLSPDDVLTALEERELLTRSKKGA